MTSRRTGEQDRLERLLRRLRRLALHQRTQITFKAAVAAAVAWWLAGLLARGDFEHYRYYAPLGAVVAANPTVASSLRTSLNASAAILVGGVVGLAVHWLVEPGLLAIALAVGGGVAAAGLPFLGDSRSYTPVVSLFVLVIGGSEALVYTAAYVGFALLGALVTVLANVLLPALRLTEGREALASAQRVLAAQLEDVAAGLRQDTPPEHEDWQRRRQDIEPVIQQMRQGVGEVLEASRANARARRHEREIHRQGRVARALERIGFLVDDVVTVVIETHYARAPRPLDSGVAQAVAEALESLAVLVRAYDTDLAEDDARVLEGERAVLDLTDAFSNRRDLDAADVAVLGAVVANLRRSLWTVAPGRAPAVSDDDGVSDSDSEPDDTEPDDADRDAAPDRDGGRDARD